MAKEVLSDQWIWRLFILPIFLEGADFPATGSFRNGNNAASLGSFLTEGTFSMWFGYLADALVAAHFALVVFICIGQVAIVVGAICRWQWIRNLWFRLAHVVAMTTVGLQAVFGVHCPLTIWENDLRSLAGQSVSEATFIGRVLNELLFVEFSTQTLNAIHIGFALVVLATFVLVPPRWPWIPAPLQTK